MVLVAPVASTPVRNWPAQNENNLNEIDSRVGIPTLQSYVPVLTGTGTPPNLGNTGTITGRFYTVLDFVYSWGFFRFGGTGIDSGSSTFVISLPLSADTQYRADPDSGQGAMLGNAVCYDDSTSGNRQCAVVQLQTRTTIIFNLQADGSGSRAAGGSSGGRPFTWVTGDGIFWEAKYKVGT